MSTEVYADPWSDVQKSTFAPQRTGSKRRRRALFTLSKNEEKQDVTEDVPADLPPAPANSSISTDSSSTVSRRRMRPAVSWMSVRVERRALQEIRSIKEAVQRDCGTEEQLSSSDVDDLTIERMLDRATDKLQAVDMTLEEFALHYVSGHSNKRGQASAMSQTKPALASSI